MVAAKPVAKPKFKASMRPRVRADGSVVHDVRYRLASGKQSSAVFVTEKAALKWKNVLHVIGPDEALKLIGTTVGNTPTVDEFAEKFIRTKSGVEGKTTDDYRMFMRLHIGPFLGHLPLDAVTTDAIAEWINAQADSGAAAKSIKNRHGFMYSMFQQAVDDEVITKNPCRRSRLPEMESTEMVFLSNDEFTSLLAYIPAHYQPLVLLLVASGLRWGEATALRPSDFEISEDRWKLRVSRAWKYGMQKRWYIGPPKTKRSKRDVSLPNSLRASIMPLIDSGSEYIFMNSSGAPVRQSNFLRNVWDPARRLANGLPAFEKGRGADPERAWAARTNGIWVRQPAIKPMGKSPRVHDLRHTHASWQLAAGLGIDVLQDRLGHESITTTVDRYGHLAQWRLDAAADTIERQMAGAMPQLEA